MDLSSSPWPWASLTLAQADEKRREREMYTLSPTSVRLNENNKSETKVHNLSGVVNCQRFIVKITKDFQLLMVDFLEKNPQGHSSKLF